MTAALRDRHYDELDDDANVAPYQQHVDTREQRDASQVDVADVMDEVVGRERDSLERALEEINRQLENKSRQLEAERERHDQAMTWVDDRIADVQADLAETSRHDEDKQARLRAELQDWYAEKLAELQQWRRHEADLVEQQDALRRERRDIRDDLAALASVDAVDDLLDGLVGDADVKRYLDDRQADDGSH